MSFFEALTGDTPQNVQQPQQASPGMDAMMQPMAPEVQQMMQPPANGEELQQRMSGWQRLTDRINNDPNLQRALIQFGAHISAPMGWGETGFGRTLGAVNSGMSAYGLGAREQESQGQREEQLNLERMRTESTVENQRAQTGMAQQRLKLDQEKGPLELQKLQADIAAITTQADLYKVKMEIEQKELEVKKLLDPVKQAQMQESLNSLKVDLEKARIRSENAQAGAAGASAQNSLAHAQKTRDEMANPDKYKTKSAQETAFESQISGYSKLFEDQNPKPGEPGRLQKWTADKAAYVEKKLGSAKARDRSIQDLYTIWDESKALKAKHPDFNDYVEAVQNGTENAEAPKAKGKSDKRVIKWGEIGAK